MVELTLSSNEFKALSSETRVRIIKLLGERNHTLTELAKKMEMASPSMKQHLDLLLASELIRQIDEGRKWKYYCLTRKGEKIIAGRESGTTILLALAVSSVALLAVLIMLFGTIGAIGTPVSMSSKLADILPTYEVAGSAEGVAGSAGGIEHQDNKEQKADRAQYESSTTAQANDLMPVYALVVIALSLAAIVGFMLAKFYTKGQAIFK